MAQLLKGTLFSPYFTGPLLFLLTAAPLSLRDPLLLRLPVNYSTPLATSLKWLFALGLVGKVNRWLSNWANRKWLWRDDKSAWDWRTEVAVVTGGSGGIGAFVVKGLASKGVKVAVVDIQPLSDDLRTSANVYYYHCDITSRDEVKKTGEAIRSALGSPSILVNNAGIGNGHKILDATPERLRAIFDVNLISHWYTVQEFLPDMLARKKGHIMSTASMASFLGVAGMVDYCATKVGLLAFHEGLVQEIKYRYNCPEIKTTIVHPGWTRTRLIDRVANDLKKAGAPILEPKMVGDIMVKQILDVKSGQIILGPSFASMLRGIPTWLQERVRDKSSGFAKVRATTGTVR